MLSPGFSLIEVLVSLLLLSLILMGFDAFCLSSVRGLREDYYFTQASNQVSMMSERLRALDAADGMHEQIEQWNKENATVLPLGKGEVSGSYPNYVITVYWGEKQSECTNMRIGGAGCIREKLYL